MSRLYRVIEACTVGGDEPDGDRDAPPRITLSDRDLVEAVDAPLAPVPASPGDDGDDDDGITIDEDPVPMPTPEGMMWAVLIADETEALGDGLFVPATTESGSPVMRRSKDPFLIPLRVVEVLDPVDAPPTDDELATMRAALDYADAHTDPIACVCGVCGEDCYSETFLTRHMQMSHPSLHYDGALYGDDDNDSTTANDGDAESFAFREPAPLGAGYEYDDNYLNNTFGVRGLGAGGRGMIRPPLGGFDDDIDVLGIAGRERRYRDDGYTPILDIACPICEKMFASALDVQLHIEMSHAYGDEEPMLPIGGRGVVKSNSENDLATLNGGNDFGTNGRGGGDELAADEEPWANFKCPVCDMAFTTPDMATRHFDLRHGDADDVFKRTPGSRGMDLITGDDSARDPLLPSPIRPTAIDAMRAIRQYECPLCGDMLASPSLVDAHISVRHTSREFRCDECQRDFSTDADLRDHMDLIHPVNTTVFDGLLVSRPRDFDAARVRAQRTMPEAALAEPGGGRKRTAADRGEDAEEYGDHGGIDTGVDDEPGDGDQVVPGDGDDDEAVPVRVAPPTRPVQQVRPWKGKGRSEIVNDGTSSEGESDDGFGDGFGDGIGGDEAVPVRPRLADLAIDIPPNAAVGDFGDPEEPVVCPFCGDEFLTPSRAQIHIQAAHTSFDDADDDIFPMRDPVSFQTPPASRLPAIGLFTCAICSKDFLTVTQLLDHNTHFHGPGNGARRNLNDGLLMGSDDDDDDIFLKCPICSANFLSEGNVSRHIDEAHGSGGNNDAYLGDDDDIFPTEDYKPVAQTGLFAMDDDDDNGPLGRDPAAWRVPVASFDLNAAAEEGLLANDMVVQDYDSDFFDRAPTFSDDDNSVEARLVPDVGANVIGVVETDPSINASLNASADSSVFPGVGDDGAAGDRVRVGSDSPEESDETGRAAGNDLGPVDDVDGDDVGDQAKVVGAGEADIEDAGAAVVPVAGGDAVA